MNRRLGMMCVAAVVGAVGIQAQPATATGNAMSTELKAAYTRVKTNILKAAEKMPEENYAFKPTPDIRTFGALVAHVADSQTRACNALRGVTKEATAGQKTAKADIVAALKDSIADCDSAYDSLTDATAAEMVKMGQRQLTRMGALVGTVAHDNEEYGYMAVYLRLKGVVPPSSEGR